jgi:hypothetical protein
VEEGGGGGVLASGRVKSKRGSGMGREGAGEALEPEERRRGGVHGRLLRRRGGARAVAREEELGRWPGWGRRVEAKAAGGGVGKELERR